MIGAHKPLTLSKRHCDIRAKSLDPDPGSLGLNPGSAIHKCVILPAPSLQKGDNDGVYYKNSKRLGTVSVK